MEFNRNKAPKESPTSQLGDPPVFNTAIPMGPYIQPPPSNCEIPPYNEQDFLCLCKMHVHQAIPAICFTAILVNLFELAYEGVLGTNSELFDCFIIICFDVFSIALYLLLEIGRCSKSVFIYYVYLVLGMACILVDFAIAFLIFMTTFAETRRGVYLFGFRRKNSTWIHIFMTIGGICYLTFCVFQVYFYYVVMKDLRYLKRYVLNRNGRH